MARRDDYRGTPRYCVMCKNEIPVERKRDAVTCSPECTTARKNWGRSRLDAVECRYCNRPSTPEERVRYGMWKKWEKKNTGNEVFDEGVLEVNRLTRENDRLKKRLAELEASLVATTV